MAEPKQLTEEECRRMLNRLTRHRSYVNLQQSQFGRELREGIVTDPQKAIERYDALQNDMEKISRCIGNLEAIKHDVS